MFQLNDYWNQFWNWVKIAGDELKQVRSYNHIPSLNSISNVRVDFNLIKNLFQFTVLNAPIIEHNIQQNYSNEPVFYGPDGEIITEEESKFLSDIPAYPNFDYSEE